MKNEDWTDDKIVETLLHIVDFQNIQKEYLELEIDFAMKLGEFLYKKKQDNPFDFYRIKHTVLDETSVDRLINIFTENMVN